MGEEAAVVAFLGEEAKAMEVVADNKVDWVGVVEVGVVKELAAVEEEGQVREGEAEEQ